MRRHAIAILISASAFVACNAILGIQELSGDDAGLPDSGQDVTTTDTAAVDVKKDQFGSDGGCPSDDPDAAPPVGTMTLTSNTDSNGSGSIEAFRVGASRDACLSTAGIYFPLNLTSGVLVGVYSDSGNDSPKTLLAIAKFPKPILGWNTAPLDGIVPVITSQVLWFAVTSDDGKVINYLDTAGGSPTYNEAPEITDDAGHQTFPQTFVNAGLNSDGPITGYLR